MYVTSKGTQQTGCSWLKNRTVFAVRRSSLTLRRRAGDEWPVRAFFEDHHRCHAHRTSQPRVLRSRVHLAHRDDLRASSSETVR